MKIEVDALPVLERLYPIKLIRCRCWRIHVCEGLAAIGFFEGEMVDS